MKPALVRWRNVVFAVLGVVAFFPLSRAAFAAPVQWTVASGGNGHYYERIDQQGLTYSDAVADAASMSFLGLPGHLVVFETPTYSNEVQFVNDNVYPPGVQSGRAYWVGASSPDGNNPWTCVDGSVVPSSITSGWNIDHFEGPGAEGATFFQPSTTLWDYIETNSSGLASGYIVEFQPVPEPTSAILVLAGGALLAGFSLRRKV